MAQLAHYVRRIRATFCVVLASAFVAMVSIGAVNTAQHATNLDHDHGGFAALVGEIDHDDHAAAPSEADAASIDIAKGHAGAGHHHADTQAGLVGPIELASAAFPVASVRLARGDDLAADGVRPGGLKRPPRTSDIAA